MSLFPHHCTECGKWFRDGGHMYGGRDWTAYRCHQCFKKLDEEDKRKGFPGLEPSDEELEEYRRKVSEMHEKKYWEDLEKEQRIKVRVWNEEKWWAQLEKEE
jgi:hypothetical protein